MWELNPVTMGNLTKLNIKSYIDADYISKGHYSQELQRGGLYSIRGMMINAA